MNWWWVLAYPILAGIGLGVACIPLALGLNIVRFMWLRAETRERRTRQNELR